jgi:hypothetical protein
MELLARDVYRCRADAATWTCDTAPDWAVSLAEDRQLTRDVAVWRAASAVRDTDARPTGPRREDLRGHLAQRDLDRRINRWQIVEPGRRSFSARALAESIDPRLTHDPHWTALARKLDIAHRDGADIAALTRRAVSERPLRDEQPAAALRWRIVAALSESQDSREIKDGRTESAPGLGVAGSRYVEEPTRARPRRPDIDDRRAFGNQPAPGRGVTR